MNPIGKGIAVLGIMASCAFVSVHTGDIKEIMSGALVVCALLWIFG